MQVVNIEFGHDIDFHHQILVRATQGLGIATQLGRLAAADMTEKQHMALGCGCKPAGGQVQAEFERQTVQGFLTATRLLGIDIAWIIRLQLLFEIDMLQNVQYIVGCLVSHCCPVK